MKGYHIAIAFGLHLMLVWGHAKADWQDSIIVPDTPEDVLSAHIPDVECLALNVYHEARSEHREGREVVIYATLNRVNDWAHPDTICDVVKEIRRSRDTGRLVAHFSWTLDGKSDKATEAETFREIYLMSIEAMFMDYRPSLPHANEVINYHTLAVSPDWGDMEPVGIVGSHVIYTRRRDGT